MRTHGGRHRLGSLATCVRVERGLQQRGHYPLPMRTAPFHEEKAWQFDIAQLVNLADAEDTIITSPAPCDRSARVHQR